MNDWLDCGDFKQRHRNFPSVLSTTLMFDRGDGKPKVLYSPCSPQPYKESLVLAWRDERAADRPNPQVLCILLTEHPWSFQKWTFIAREVVGHYESRGVWIRDVIPYAEATAVIRLDPDKTPWQKILNLPPEKLPGWTRGFMRRLCQEACRELTRHLSGTKTLHRAIIELEQIADRTDADAMLIAQELRLIVETYSGPWCEMLRFWLDGMT